MPHRQILANYRSLEKRVGQVMSVICSPFCKVCPTPCCRVGICREAQESPFLRAVQPTPVEFSATLGFLGAKGCRLSTGRPPICHAFVCHTIKENQPTDHHRYAIDCLGDLINFIGTGICKGRHLVEALTEEDLQHIDMPQFQQRLSIAESAFTALQHFFDDGRPFTPIELDQLAVIRPLAY